MFLQATRRETTAIKAFREGVYYALHAGHQPPSWLTGRQEWHEGVTWALGLLGENPPKAQSRFEQGRGGWLSESSQG